VRLFIFLVSFPGPGDYRHNSYLIELFNGTIATETHSKYTIIANIKLEARWGSNLHQEMLSVFELRCRRRKGEDNYEAQTNTSRNVNYPLGVISFWRI
jgi:hypothetical protein